MKITENQAKVLQTCIQSIITALLLFIQGFFFSGCITNKDGTINQTNDFSVPIIIPQDFEMELPNE